MAKANSKKTTARFEVLVRVASGWTVAAGFPTWAEADTHAAELVLASPEKECTVRDANAAVATEVKLITAESVKAERRAVQVAKLLGVNALLSAVMTARSAVSDMQREGECIIERQERDLRDAASFGGYSVGGWSGHELATCAAKAQGALEVVRELGLASVRVWQAAQALGVDCGPVTMLVPFGDTEVGEPVAVLPGKMGDQWYLLDVAMVLSAACRRLSLSAREG